MTEGAGGGDRAGKGGSGDLGGRDAGGADVIPGADRPGPGAAVIGTLTGGYSARRNGGGTSAGEVIPEGISAGIGGEGAARAAGFAARIAPSSREGKECSRPRDTGVRTVVSPMVRSWRRGWRRL